MMLADGVEVFDGEAKSRAHHVENLLAAYIANEQVAAYTLSDDGAGFSRLPTDWVSHQSFAVCLRTGRYRVFTDAWDRLWVDGPELLAALPPEGQPRKKHSYEWDKIVNEGWMFSLRLGRIPTKAEIVRHLGGWCAENDQGVPEGSQLAKVAKTIVDFLHENKTRWEDFGSKSFEARDVD